MVNCSRDLLGLASPRLPIGTPRSHGPMGRSLVAGRKRLDAGFAACRCGFDDFPAALGCSDRCMEAAG
jgi:hypothetical protein